MSYTPAILALAGSARNASFNKKLVAVAAVAARRAGASVDLIDLGDYPMPLYNGDLQEKEGIPEQAKRLRETIAAHDGLLIASPEYNTAFAPLLKNAIDWTSRADGDVPMLACWRGKTAALMAASPSALGGMRGLVQLRAMLGAIGVLVLPEQVTVPQADSQFDDAGRLTDPKLQTAVENLAQRLTDVVRRLYA